MAQCDPRRGVNAIAAFNEVWPLVQKEIKVPEGYTMKYFGEQESQVESNEALAKNFTVDVLPDVRHAVVPVQDVS